MKIGIIQTRGLGDIVIAAPIAMYYIERGCEVYWPIDSDFTEPFQFAFPRINFISIDKNKTGENSADYFYNSPLKSLQEKSCDRIICLYSYLTGHNFGNSETANAISFDAYKYAIAKVPLSEKWNLKIKRNPVREAKIFEMLDLDPSDSYVVIHDQGSVHKADFSKIIPTEVKKIKISSLTNNPLDWLGVIENAKSAFVVNSLYSNLIDQLNCNIEKNIFTRTDPKWTPIFLNNWNYL